MHYDAGVVEHAAYQGSLMAGTTESQKVESKTANARRVDYHLAAAKVLERSSFRALSRGTIRLQSIITAARSVAPDQRPVCDSSAISLWPSASLGGAEHRRQRLYRSIRRRTLVWIHDALPVLRKRQSSLRRAAPCSRHWSGSSSARYWSGRLSKNSTPAPWSSPSSR